MEGYRSVMGTAGDRLLSERELEFIIKSYRYLRLSIVALIVALGTSMAWQVAITDRFNCMEGSVSAYYYTAVHSLFIGALIAMGVSMIAIKGRSTVEDAYFNIAGFLAPVVAIVPTDPSGKLCSGKHPLSIDRELFVGNGMASLLAGAALTIGAVALILKRRAKNGHAPPVKFRAVFGAATPGVAPAGLVGIGIVIAKLLGKSWLTSVHLVAAIGVFVSIWIVVMSLCSEGFHRFIHRRVAWQDEGSFKHRPPADNVKNLYRAVAVSMPVGGAAVAGITALVSTDHWVLVLEAWEIALFGVFWAVQTGELWNVLPSAIPVETATGSAETTS